MGTYGFVKSSYFLNRGTDVTLTLLDILLRKTNKGSGKEV